MNRDKMQDALSHISDKHIAEAAAPKKRRYAPWISAIAACLVLAIGLGIVLHRLPGEEPGPAIIEQSNPTEPDKSQQVFIPDEIQVIPLAAAQYPETLLFPLDQSNFQAWDKEYETWFLHQRELHSAPEGYADSLTDFWKKSTQTFLTGDDRDNMLYSPISLYMALSILAQATAGETRQEILTLLGADNMAGLAQQAKYVFENQYQNDGVHTSILANSLWLDDQFTFKQDTVDAIAENFYASVYRGALESPEMNTALKNWLSKQTGGLLDESIMALEPMEINTALAIASTINYRCKWQSAFLSSQNTQKTFYGTKGDNTVTYMNKTLLHGEYYWGEGYSATSLPLDDGSRMWLILPNEDTTAAAVLQEGKAMDMILGEDDSAGYLSLRVNLSVPKFDVVEDLNLIEGLQELGIRKAMDYYEADFSAINNTLDGRMWLQRAQQAIRVSIDEEGLTGVAYTLMVAPGDGMPSMEEVDFVLDRPFLFVVESPDGLPLFTGIVNNP